MMEILLAVWDAQPLFSTWVQRRIDLVNLVIVLAWLTRLRTVTTENLIRGEKLYFSVRCNDRIKNNRSDASTEVSGYWQSDLSRRSAGHYGWRFHAASSGYTLSVFSKPSLFFLCGQRTLAPGRIVREQSLIPKVYQFVSAFVEFFYLLVFRSFVYFCKAVLLDHIVEFVDVDCVQKIRRVRRDENLAPRVWVKPEFLRQFF